MSLKSTGATRLASSSKTYGAGGVRRQRERDFGRVFTGLLFALFVATLLMAILAGTDVYRGLNREGDAADNQRLSLTLLANDVRANDQIDAVACAWVTEDGAELTIAEGREALRRLREANLALPDEEITRQLDRMEHAGPPGCTRRGCIATTASSWKSTPWPTPPTTRPRPRPSCGRRSSISPTGEDC